jgi:FkbM family methyltransferase
MTHPLVSYWLFYFLRQHGIRITIKGIFGYLKWVLKRLRYDFSKEYLIKVNDCDLLLIPHDSGISEELLLFKSHEPYSTKILQQHLHEGMVCLDIGGNLGYYATLESKKVGNSGKVIAIEPSPLNFKYLKHNLQLQKMNNFEVHNLACGDSDGIVKFLISDHSNASRVIGDEEKIDSSMNIIEVSVKRVDQLIEDFNIKQVDFLRMDVEGYESYILKGATLLLNRFKPMIQLELHFDTLGQNKTEIILEDFKNIGYHKLSYIAAELDTPLTGTEKNVQNTTIKKLIQDVKDNNVPRCFIMLLEKPTI